MKLVEFTTLYRQERVFINPDLVTYLKPYMENPEKTSIYFNATNEAKSFIVIDNAINDVINSLEQIQNRGYDSVGIAMKTNEYWNIEKSASINNEDGLTKLQEKILNKSTTMALAHTRWATHGSKSERNSHPHTSMNNNIILVHNGIISNFQELKNFLREKNYTFYSETDTEVIANLIEYYLKDNDIETSIKLASDNMIGTWALGIINTFDPDNIYITRYGSPLVLGYNDELIMLPESGYYIYQTNEYKMIMDLADIGPNYQPGHAHADTFSFEVSIHKNKFIVNLGISSYQGEETRVKERGTSNHSTLLIDGKNSSDVWGEFRVGQRAKIISKNISRESNDLILQASHDGYKRIYGSPIHRREFVLSKKSIAINDSISGSGNHEVTILFHLHPEVIILGHDDSSIDLMHEELNITFNSSLMSSLQIIESMYAPEFGMQVPTKSIALKEKLSFPSTINSSFTW